MSFAHIASGGGVGDLSFIASELKDRFILHGHEDYSDDSAPQTMVNGAWTVLTNNGLGARTSVEYALPDSTGFWDATLNEINWANGGVELGDIVGVRIHVDTITDKPNTEVDLRLDMADGSVTEYELPFTETAPKTTGVHTIFRYFEVTMDNVETLNNPATVSCYTDDTNTTVNTVGFKFFAKPRFPVLKVI